MKQKSIKLNYILNTSKTILGMIFPLITFPYVSRVLMPEGVGKVAFANSAIAYFILLASIGIPYYGLRECAKVRDNKETLSKLTQEIFFINLIATAISYVLFFTVLFCVPQLYNQKLLLMITSSSIFFSTLGIEWLYQGLEQYGYITLRSLIFQIISAVLLFLSVKSKNDYLIYAVLLVFSSVGSNVINFIHARKIIYFKKYTNYNLKRHLKPIFMMFSLSLAISMYVNLDSVMLGFLSGEKAVGLYSASIKINRMVLVLVNSMGNVLIPRISYYLQQQEHQKFDELIVKSLDFMLMLALPAIIGLFILSDEIILLFSGKGFASAILTMKIISPIILMIGLSNLMGVQLLIPLGKEKWALYSILIGAFINFSLNLLLIPRYAENGAALSTVVTESVITLVQLCFTWSFIGKHLLTKSKLSVLFASGLLVPVLLLMKLLFNNIALRLTLAFVIGGVVYLAVLFMFKNQLLKEINLRVLRGRIYEN